MYIYIHTHKYIYLYPSHETKRTLSSHRTRVQLVLSPPPVLALTSHTCSLDVPLASGSTRTEL